MKVVIFLLMLLQVVGCSVVHVKNAREAKLMPESVARNILSRYLNADWVNNPTGMAIHQNVCPGTYPMPIESIKHVTEFHGRQMGQIWLENWDWPYWNAFPCGSKSRMIIKRDSAFSEDELNEIADALVSLGAKLEGIEHK